MESQLSEESLWAGALAARLRLLQANFADDEPATRTSFIVQEIEAALKGCAPEKKKTRLQALASRFPTWQGSALPQQSRAAASPAETPESLLNRLLECLPELPADKRQQFVERLKQAGLVSERPAAASFEITPEVHKRLGLEAGRLLNAERAARSFTMFLDLALALDQFAWRIWKEIAPKSLVRKEADLTRLAAQFLAGGEEVSAAQLMQCLERSRKLIASYLGATRPAGHEYAKNQARLLDPNSIEVDARVEKKWNESVDVAAWRKYRDQLFKEYGAEQVIERSVQEALVKQVEVLFRGGAVG
jgi:hypothetical protein